MLQEIKDWWSQRQTNKQLEKNETESLRQEALAEAKLEYRDEAKEILKAKYKQEALDKLQGKNTNQFAKKLGKGLENLGKGAANHFKNMDMDKKLQGMVGTSRGQSYQEEEVEQQPRRRKSKKKVVTRRKRVVTPKPKPKLKVYNKFPKRDIREFI